MAAARSCCKAIVSFKRSLGGVLFGSSSVELGRHWQQQR